MRILILTLLLLSSLFAHKLNIFLYEEDNKIFLNSYFASGTPCKECKVEIFDEKYRLLQTAKTNKDGDYGFEKLASKLSVKVETIGGHAATSSIEPKKIKNRKEDILKPNSFLQSFFAIFLIILIFVGLKRFKK